MLIEDVLQARKLYNSKAHLAAMSDYWLVEMRACTYTITRNYQEEQVVRLHVYASNRSAFVRMDACVCDVEG